MGKFHPPRGSRQPKVDPVEQARRRDEAEQVLRRQAAESERRANAEAQAGLRARQLDRKPGETTAQYMRRLAVWRQATFGAAPPAVQPAVKAFTQPRRMVRVEF